MTMRGIDGSKFRGQKKPDPEFAIAANVRKATKDDEYSLKEVLIARSIILNRNKSSNA